MCICVCESVCVCVRVNAWNGASKRSKQINVLEKQKCKRTLTNTVAVPLVSFNSTVSHSILFVFSLALVFLYFPLLFIFVLLFGTYRRVSARFSVVVAIAVISSFCVWQQTKYSVTFINQIKQITLPISFWLYISFSYISFFLIFFLSLAHVLSAAAVAAAAVKKVGEKTVVGSYSLSAVVVVAPFHRYTNCACVHWCICVHLFFVIVLRLFFVFNINFC